MPTVLAARTGLWPLRGSVLPHLERALRLARVAKSRSIHISVYLKVRNEGRLSRFLRDVYDPRSPQYHHFLSPQEFARRFGPARSERAAVVRWLQAGGLRVGNFSPNGLQVSARGTAAAVSAAFHTPLYYYRRGAQRFFANSRPVSLPGSLSGAVAAIAGLTNIASQKPSGIGFHVHPHAADAPSGFTPGTLARLYNLTDLYNRGLKGSGQTMAIVSFADYRQTNLDTYDRQFGLTNTVERVIVRDGASVGGSEEQEAEGDAEIAQGIAPAARILMYEADNSDEGALAIYNQIVSDGRAQVVTTSWGTWEAANAADTIGALSTLLQEAAAQGQAVFAASGDAGAFDQAQGSEPGDATALAVDFPASDPWVTGVGGTTLRADGSQYGGETVWSDSSHPDQPTGSGGGLSDSFSRPAYQFGPGVENTYSNGMRQVPDVSAAADGDYGYAIFTVTGSRPGWGNFGGTSASAPLWAGFAALVNQSAGHPLGFLNPSLYALGRRAQSFAHPPYHDVTEGTNLYYPATPGWDFATGWGSFDAPAFIDDIAALRPSDLGGTPAATPTRTPTRAPASTPAPTATMTPTEHPVATSTPSVTPVPATVHIDGVVILRTINGKQQPVKALRLHQKATFAMMYHVTGSGTAFARLVITKNGRQIEAAPLQGFSYAGKPAFGTNLTFVTPAASGKLYAHFTIAVGSTSAKRDRKFQVLTGH